MTKAELLRTRLHNQLLLGNTFTAPHEIVSYMGAMQSQAFDMARWAIGARLSASTDRRIIEAIDNAEIIRTHILRPTWHFVAAEDIHWMSELSMPRLRPVYKSYARLGGVDESIFPHVWPFMERAMRDHNHLTRPELTERLLAEKLDVNLDLVSCMLGFAELEGLVCNGRVKGNKQTYCLLQERVPKKQLLSKEESLEKLARKFFQSHAPATLQDFIWWSGLLASDAKKAVNLLGDDFVQEEMRGRTFFFQRNLRIPDATGDVPLLLPQFDEMVVSYKDRSEMIEDEHYGKVMTKNGIFSPTIMMNGEIIGSWRKVVVKKQPDVELTFFENTTKKVKDQYKKAIKSYIAYLEGSPKEWRRSPVVC